MIHLPRKEVAFAVKKLIGIVTLCTMTACAGWSATVPATAQASELPIATTAADEVKYMNLSSKSIIANDQVYLPLRSTFADMYMSLNWRVDGTNTVRVSNAYESYDLYLSEDGSAIKLQNYGNGYGLVAQGGCTYVPLQFFQDIISNYDIGMSGDNLLVLFQNGANAQSFWQNMNATTVAVEAPIAEPTVQPEEVCPADTSAPAEKPLINDAPPVVSVAGTGQLNYPTVLGAMVTSPFGLRDCPWGTGPKDFHLGIDLAAAKGTPIYAADEGTIVRAETFYSYGYCIDVQHDNGMITRYAHLDQMQVKVGQRVVRGQAIATMGMTGAATGPHLHFEVILNGKQVDPAPYIGV